MTATRGRKLPTKRLVVAAAIAVVLAAVAVGAFRATKCGGSVLWAYREAGDPLDEPSFLILNPLRDRAPERAADEFLAALKAGRAEAALSPLHAPNGDTLQEKERQYRIAAWRLRNRTDSADRVRLFFRVVRVGGGDGDPLWLDVVKRGDRWQVASLECWY